MFTKSIADMPLEILTNIAELLPYKLCTLSAVSKQMRAAVGILGDKFALSVARDLKFDKFPKKNIYAFLEFVGNYTDVLKWDMNDMFQAATAKDSKCSITMITMMLYHSSVDPTIEYDSALRCASMYGHFKIVRALINDGRADQTMWNHCPLGVACSHGKHDVVELLLQDSTINAYELEINFFKAVNKGHPKVLALLLNDARFNPNATSSTESPILSASQAGHHQVIDVLLNDPRINRKDVAWCYKTAIECNRTQVAEVLARYL